MKSKEGMLPVSTKGEIVKESVWELRIPESTSIINSMPNTRKLKAIA